MEQRSAERGQRDQSDVRAAWEMALRRKKWVRWIVSWLPHQLTIAIRSLLRWEHLIIAKVRHRWHRSLQLRVVSTTLVISAAVIAVLGFFLTAQIGEPYLAYVRAVPRLVPRLIPRLRATPVPTGNKPHWLQAVLSEITPIGVFVTIAFLSWTYDVGLMDRAILIAFGLSLVIRALLPGLWKEPIK